MLEAKHTPTAARPGADDRQAGAAALQALIKRFAEKNDADVGAAAEGPGDPRDYRAMVDMLAADLAANLQHANTAHREGYLRAFAHLLSHAADGGCVGSDWDPLRATAAAFQDHPGHPGHPGSPAVPAQGQVFVARVREGLPMLVRLSDQVRALPAVRGQAAPGTEPGHESFDRCGAGRLVQDALQTVPKEAVAAVLADFFFEREGNIERSAQHLVGELEAQASTARAQPGRGAG